MDFGDLDPQRVLDALQAVGLRGDGRVLQLNSYENRVYQVFLDDGSAVVAKFYRPGRWTDAQIVEEHAFALELAAAEVPVVAPLPLSPPAPMPGLQLLGTPPTLARLGAGRDAHRFAVARRSAGREPELEDPETLRQLGRFIGRLHAVGAVRPFLHRHRLDARADGHRAVALLVDRRCVPDTELPAWRQAAERALDLLCAAFETRFDAAAPLANVRLHGDFHLGNVLWRDGRAHIVDLDDAMQGPAVQDLWMLVSGDAATLDARLGLLLEGYGQFRDFDRRELALIEPLRTLRMLRHSAWLAERWQDPTFPHHFPFFGSAAYWNQQTAQLREQTEAMSATD